MDLVGHKELIGKMNGNEMGMGGTEEPYMILQG